MAEKRYIQVILPLRLGWEPFYALPSGISVQVGDRVKVLFSRKPYLAVVSRTDTEPSIDNRKVFTIQSVEADLPRVSEQEIAFWRQVADYYLCSIGEVYKLAYPAARAEEMKATANQAMTSSPVGLFAESPPSLWKPCQKMPTTACFMANSSNCFHTIRPAQAGTGSPSGAIQNFRKSK